MGKQVTELDTLPSFTDTSLLPVHNSAGLKKGSLSQLANYLGTKFSNPNLLINPDFKINQRGGSTYSSQYSVDRWKIYNALYNVSIKNLSNPNSSDGNFIQTFENLLNGTYTITVHCSSVTGKANFTWGGESVIVKEEVGDLKEGNNIVTIKATDLRFIGVLVKPGASVIIDYIKLEQGSVATPFVAPNIAEELIKCKRFYKSIEFTEVFYSGTKSTEYIFSYVIQNMRIKPTATSNIKDHYGLSAWKTTVNDNNNGLTVKAVATSSMVGDCNIGGIVKLDAEIY